MSLFIRRLYLLPLVAAASRQQHQDRVLVRACVTKRQSVNVCELHDALFFPDASSSEASSPPTGEQLTATKTETRRRVCSIR